MVGPRRVLDGVACAGHQGARSRSRGTGRCQRMAVGRGRLRPARGAADSHALARSELLRGFRIAFPPERIPPHGGEHDTELAAGITISAERLRMIAFAAPRQASWSPGNASPAWLRTARAIAVISDLAERTLRALAGRSAQLSGPPVHVGALDDAASDFRDARITWEEVTTLWRAMSTDSQTPLSAATTETGDLVLRMGRLVFDNPQWTPAFSQRAPLRSPASLAPDHAAFTAALSAVHQSADAAVCQASADLDPSRQRIRPNACICRTASWEMAGIRGPAVM